MSKKYICTYFDKNYLPRGLVLYKSIKKFIKDFDLYILALDDFTYKYLLELGDRRINVLSIKEYKLYFEVNEEKFNDKKQFYFSITPNLCIYVLKMNSHVDVLLYLDSDTCLFNSIEPLYRELEHFSIGICSHRLNPILSIFSRHYGHYNVGVNYFRNDEEGKKCLIDWKKDCESWTPNKPGYPLSFFSDQIFLDNWPKKYQNLKIIEHIGVNTAPWNVVNYKISKQNGSFYVNSEPLLIYHFSNLAKISHNKWHANTNHYVVFIKDALLDLYLWYIMEIEKNGLNNNKIVKLSHKSRFVKRLFYFFIKPFLNDEIIMK